MNVVFFVHSIVSDWNHGNAHFLRGVAGELMARGHRVEFLEPRDGWSRRHLLADHGEEALAGFAAAYPGLSSRTYDLDHLDLDEVLAGADLVLVHEWNDPELVRRVGEHRARHDRYRLLFHDTHHRAVSDPGALASGLRHYDGALVFGRVLCDLYRKRGWVPRSWTWHEAADVRVFRPVPGQPLEGDVVWIGNWGDGERAEELHRFLIEPVRALGLRARVYGVRYPPAARRALRDAGIEYAGWLPNFQVPHVFARFRATVHVPRRPYARALRGIPTIRPFEALACGVPLVSAPWEDVERLFSPGLDYLVAHTGEEMTEHLRRLMEDEPYARSLAERGLRTIMDRHTCRHRVEELMQICAQLFRPPALEVTA